MVQLVGEIPEEQLTPENFEEESMSREEVNFSRAKNPLYLYFLDPTDPIEEEILRDEERQDRLLQRTGLQLAEAMLLPTSFFRYGQEVLLRHQRTIHRNCFLVLKKLF